MLLEREVELEYVARALRLASSGKGSAVVISGSLGIGKSAFLRALPKIAAVQDARCLWASGSALERDFALGVVRQLFGPLLLEESNELRDRLLAGPAAPSLAVFDDHSWPGSDSDDAVTVALDALVRTVAGARPLLILVDDLQWVDEPSQRWLGRLARAFNGMPVVIAATVREGDPGAEVPLVRELVAAAHVLRPRPLTASATRALAAAQFDTQPADEFAAACHEMSHGCPLIVRSLLLGLALQGISPVAEAVETIGSLRPAAVRDRTIGSIKAQPEPGRRFVTALAVLGDDVDMELIGRLAGLDALGCAAAVRRLRLAGLLVGEDQPRFIHAVVQEAAGESMTADERDRLHLRAAKELMSGGFSVEEVATQLLATLSPLGSEEIETLRCAAEDALRRSAPKDATRYLRRALVDCAADDGQERASVLVDLAAATRGLDPLASVRYIGQAVLLLGTAREKAVVSTRIPPVVLTQASQPTRDLIHHLADALGEPAKLTGADRELALRLAARTWCADNDDPLRLAAAAERLQSFGPRLSLDSEAERELTAVLAHAAMLTGRTTADQVAGVANLILEREPAIPGHVYTAVPMLVPVLAAADDLTGLASWLDTAERQARSQNAVVELALISAERGFVLACMGLQTEAKALVLDAVKLTTQDLDVMGETYMSSLLGIALELRDDDLTTRLLSRCGEQSNRAPVARMLRMSTTVARREPAQTLDELMEIGRLLERAGRRNPVLFSWRTWAANLYWRLGSVEAAVALLWEQHELAEAWGAPSAIGRSLRMLGRLTEGPRGVALLRDSVDVLQTSANRLELANALLALGLRLRSEELQGDVHALRRSLQVAEDVGALGLARRIVGHAGGKLTRVVAPARSTLTKSELMVAGMVLAGQSNAEIATQLGVTRRAVEKHLTNSYRKLGIRGREGLAVALDQ